MWCAGDDLSLKTCPASFILRVLIVADTLLSDPYSVSLLILSLQLMFKTFLSIRVYVPSSDFSSCLVRVQVELPYRSMVSVVARKSSILISRDISLDHTLFSLWIDFHANAFRVLYVPVLRTPTAQVNKILFAGVRKRLFDFCSINTVE